MDRNVQFTIEFKDKATGAINRMQLSLKDADEVINEVRSAMNGLNADVVNAGQAAQAFGAAMGAVRQLGSALGSLVEGYNDYAVAEARLAQVMRNTMGATDADVQAIVDLCRAQQDLGVVEDDVTMAGAQELGTYLELRSSLETLIPVLNDMLAQQYGVNATQDSAVAIATMLGKVMEGQTSALSRYGYSFDEAQEKILKFGTEEEKAATLADVVSESVGGMNSALLETDAGRMKQARMELDGVKDALGKLGSGALPFLNIASEAGIAMMGVGQLGQALKSVTAALKGSSAAAAAAAVHDRVLAAAKRLLSAATKDAAVSTGALTVAVTALYAALTLGISAAITGLVALFSSMGRKAGEASGEMESLKSAQESFSQASGDARGRIESETARLKALIDAKKDTRKAVADLNAEYGKIFGTYSTAAKWYDVLKAKSAVYCQQIGYEAQARVLAQRKAEAELERDSVQSRMDKLKPRAFATRDGMRQYASMGQSVRELDGEIAALGKQFDSCTGKMAEAAATLADGKGDFDSATASYDELKNEIDLLETQMKALRPTEVAELNSIRQRRDAYKALYEAMGKRLGLDKGGGKDEYDGKRLIAGASSYKALGNNIAYYREQLEKTDPARADEMARISGNIRALEEQQQKVKMLTSAAAMEYATESSSLDVINANIALQQELRKSASKETIAGIDAEIRRLEALREAVEEAGFEEKKPEDIETYEELNRQLQHYQKKLQGVPEVSRASIQQTIDGLEALRKAWDAALLDIPTDPSNLDEYDRAISALYTRLPLAGDADRLGIQKTIAQLEAERDARKNLLKLPAIQSEVARLDSLEGQDLQLQLQLIGYDGIAARISALRAMLSDPLSPLTEEQRADIRKTVKSLDGYAGGMRKAQNISEGASQAFTAVGGVLGSLGDVVSEQAGQWLQWGASILQAIARAIPQIVELTAARRTETVAATGAAATEAGASVASVPLVGPILAVSAIASVLAAIASIPKFADGGIAYGPTLGLFGEYAGASNNPEVVAPLDRLRGMIGDAGGYGGKVTFEIEGRKLVGILNKESRITSRG